jgi:hypothetical protein
VNDEYIRKQFAEQLKLKPEERADAVVFRIGAKSALIVSTWLAMESKKATSSPQRKTIVALAAAIEDAATRAENNGRTCARWCTRKPFGPHEQCVVAPPPPGFDE